MTEDDTASCLMCDDGHYPHESICNGTEAECKCKCIIFFWGNIYKYIKDYIQEGMLVT